ncbi:MAG: hypothetical protein AAGA78_04515 [Pseudomonadota bacterium]
MTARANHPWMAYGSRFAWRAAAVCLVVGLAGCTDVPDPAPERKELSRGYSLTLSSNAPEPDQMILRGPNGLRCTSSNFGAVVSDRVRGAGLCNTGVPWSFDLRNVQVNRSPHFGTFQSSIQSARVSRVSVDGRPLRLGTETDITLSIGLVLLLTSDVVLDLN